MKFGFYIMISFQLFFFYGIIKEIHAQSSIGTIPLPTDEYIRLRTEKGDFGSWLRRLPLKKNGSPVVDYRGNIFRSGSDSTVAAVVDWRIEGQRLEQCMDILIRFYAEFLWEEGKTTNLQLPLPGGYWLNWNDWKNGFRPQFMGIKVSLFRKARPDHSYSSLIAYLKTVFNVSHTQQFYHAYKPVKRTDVRIGDFIVRKGTKGHAVMIVDLAKNKKGELIALIGNGDTPACQFFLLNFRVGNPWIPLDFGEDALDLPLRRKMSWDGLRRFNLPLNH